MDFECRDGRHAPMPSESDGGSVHEGTAPASRARAFIAWTLAVVGTTAAVLGAMGVVSVLAAMLATCVMDGAVSVSADTLDPFAMDIGVLVAQLSVIAITLPWWRQVLARSLVSARCRSLPRRSTADVFRTWVSLLLLGLGLQVVISLLLTLVSLIAPVLIEDYNELMEDAGIGVLSPLNVLTTVILAPVSEEIVCRGILLEYGLRAASPAWRSRVGARDTSVGAVAFLAGNALQAAAFGFMHLNIVQGAYAFALGLILGWVYWKTGKLRYAVGLHLAVNASSFLIDPLFELSAWLPELVGTTWFLVIGMGSLVGGALLFARVWCSGAPAAPASPVASLDGASTGEQPAPVACNEDVLGPE